MSDHFLVEARLKLVGGWRSAERMEGVRNVLKVSQLNNRVKERAYLESLRGKYEVWRGEEVESEKWGREDNGVNGGMKKLVGRWPKREELLRNSFREEIGSPMTDTGHREWL